MPCPGLRRGGTRMASGITELASWPVNGVFFQTRLSNFAVPSSRVGKPIRKRARLPRRGAPSGHRCDRVLRIQQGARSILWDDKEYSFWVDLHARRSTLGEGKVGTTATPARTRKIIPFCCCGDVPQFQMMRLPLKADDRSGAAKMRRANESLTACEFFHKVACNRFTEPTFSAPL